MFNEENITRRSNLAEQDSLSCYMGHTAQQNPHAYKAFYDFFEITKPARILEIGTAMGGFTMFLRLCCNDLNLNTVIKSYDINGRQSYDYLRTQNIEINVENIFDGNYTGIKQEVINYIQEEGPTIILCDGGNKIAEFNVLSKFLKQGDFILAHDYASTEQHFQTSINGIYWNWLEIQDSDIQQAVELNNLEPYMQDTFDQAVWVCKIKK